MKYTWWSLFGLPGCMCCSGTTEHPKDRVGSKYSIAFLGSNSRGFSQYGES